MDKKRKKELRASYKKEEISRDREKMCLDVDQLRELLGYLSNSIEGLGIPCDHTLGRTKEWIQIAKLDEKRVLESVREFGGYCDCEVLMNVEPYKFGWPE